MSVHQTKDGRYFVKYAKGTDPDEPNRTREYCGRGIAALYQAQERDDWVKMNWTRRRPKKKMSPTLAELASEYVRAKVADNEPSTISARQPKLRNIILPELGRIEALNLSDDHIRRYVENRLKSHVMVWKGPKKNRRLEAATGPDGLPKPIKRTTVSREIDDIQAIMNWAVKHRLIPYNPIVGFEKPKRDDAVIMPPTQAETAAIIAQAPEHLVRALTLAYYTGVRPGAAELTRLPWSAVDWDARTIFVISAKKGGLRSRTVPLHLDFIKPLYTWYEKDKKAGISFIIHFRGKSVTRLKRSFDTAKKKAGITRRLRPYDFRHAFATYALAAGGNLKATSEVIGHSRPDTTLKIYQHTNSELHRQAVDSLPRLKLP